MLQRCAAAAAAAADDDDDDDVTDESQTLEVVGLRYPADTGAYKCVAENSAGSSQDIATVFVQQQQQSSDTGRSPSLLAPASSASPASLSVSCTTSVIK